MSSSGRIHMGCCCLSCTSCCRSEVPSRAGRSLGGSEMIMGNIKYFSRSTPMNNISNFLTFSLTLSAGMAQCCPKRWRQELMVFSFCLILWSEFPHVEKYLELIFRCLQSFTTKLSETTKTFRVRSRYPFNTELSQTHAQHALMNFASEQNRASKASGNKDWDNASLWRKALMYSVYERSLSREPVSYPFVWM